MHLSILTLFPEMFQGPFDHSILKRAQEKNILKIDLINIRDFATDKHRTVDDRPYGGGSGMIMRVDIVDRAIHASSDKDSPCSGTVLDREKGERIILLDPQGKTFNQKIAQKLSGYEHLILLCGHYEGVDERVRKLVDEEISIGDYILTGGEIPAMVLIDSIVRLIPGVFKKAETVKFESFSTSYLEYPQYTRPASYQPIKNAGLVSRKWDVPKVLLTGNHAEIEKWRKTLSLKRTQKRRPDLTTQRG